jgi:hypothetical protein
MQFRTYICLCFCLILRSSPLVFVSVKSNPTIRLEPDTHAEIQHALSVEQAVDLSLEKSEDVKYTVHP